MCIANMNSNATTRITQLFDERRNTLRQRLLARPQAGQAEAVLRTFTDQLFLDFRQANPALTSKDGTQLNLLADSMKGGLQLMLTANKATFWQPVTSASSMQLAPNIQITWWTKLLRVIAVAALTAWLFALYSGTFERVLAGLALAVVLVAEALDWLLPTLKLREQRKAQYAQLNAAEPMNTRPQTRVEVELDVDTALLRYRDVLALADRAVRPITAALPAASPESSVPDAVLDFLQELASAHTTTDARYAAVLAAKVAGLLVPYDIEVLTNFEGVAQKNFSLVRNVDDEKATRPQLIKPAFVAQGKLLRRGEVAMPAAALTAQNH